MYSKSSINDNLLIEPTNVFFLLCMIHFFLSPRPSLRLALEPSHPHRQAKAWSLLPPAGPRWQQAKHDEGPQFSVSRACLTTSSPIRMSGGIIHHPIFLRFLPLGWPLALFPSSKELLGSDVGAVSCSELPCRRGHWPPPWHP